MQCISPHLLSRRSKYCPYFCFMSNYWWVPTKAFTVRSRVKMLKEKKRTVTKYLERKKYRNVVLFLCFQFCYSSQQSTVCARTVDVRLKQLQNAQQVRCCVVRRKMLSEKKVSSNFLTQRLNTRSESGSGHKILRRHEAFTAHRCYHSTGGISPCQPK